MFYLVSIKCISVTLTSYRFASTIFNNAILSMLFGAVFWFASVVPYLTYSSEEAYDGLSKLVKQLILRADFCYAVCIIVWSSAKSEMKFCSRLCMEVYWLHSF